MRQLDFYEIARGFLLTLFVGVILPIGVLAMIPSSGIALVFVPFWTAGTVLAFLSGSIAGRSRNLSIGTAACALLLIGIVTLPRLTREAVCRQGYIDFQPPTIRGPIDVVFDNVANKSVRSFSDHSVMLTLLTRHKVFEIERDQAGAIKGIWKFSAEDTEGCIGPDKSKVAFYGPIPKAGAPAEILPYVTLLRGLHSSSGPIPGFKYCLAQSGMDTPNDKPEGIFIRGAYASDKAANVSCRSIDVIERSAGNERLIGRFKLFDNGVLAPAPDNLRIGHHIWLNVIIRAVFAIKFLSETDDK